MTDAKKDFIADGGLEDKVLTDVEALLQPIVEKKISEATEAERMELNERLHQLARLAIDCYLKNKVAGSSR